MLEHVTWHQGDGIVFEESRESSSQADIQKVIKLSLQELLFPLFSLSILTSVQFKSHHIQVPAMASPRPLSSLTVPPVSSPCELVTSSTPPPSFHDVRNSCALFISEEPTLVTKPFDSPSLSKSSVVVHEKEVHDHDHDHNYDQTHGITTFARRYSSFMDYFNQEFAEAHTSIYLLVSFFTSGLIDSVAFNAWSCFVGMQTGMIYMGLPPLPTIYRCADHHSTCQVTPSLPRSASPGSHSMCIDTPISNLSRRLRHSASATCSSAPFIASLAGLTPTQHHPAGVTFSSALSAFKRSLLSLLPFSSRLGSSPIVIRCLVPLARGVI